MAGPLMKVECRNKRKLLRLTSLAQWCMSLPLLSLTVSSSPSFSQGTLEQRLACTPDVLRLCSAFIPDADQITGCLREKSSELGDACRTVFEAATSQPPNSSDSPDVSKRPTK